MQTIYLQSLIATNAAKITRVESFIVMDVADGKQYKKDGEVAFSLDSYASANRNRARLTKLVAMQKALKTELLSNLRLARIDRKIAKLQAVGFVYEAPGVLTSREIESALDNLIEAFVPKKADSRVVAAAV